MVRNTIKIIDMIQTLKDVCSAEYKELLLKKNTPAQCLFFESLCRIFFHVLIFSFNPLKGNYLSFY
jgi:hypothetical protein